MFEFLKYKSAVIVTACLMLCVTLLSCLVFYLSIPHIRPQRFIFNPIETSKIILNHSTADAVIIWDLNLNANNRKVLAFSSRDEKNIKIITDYLNFVKDFSVTSVLDKNEIFASIAGQHSCSTIRISQADNFPQSLKDFFSTHTNSLNCIVPVEDATGELVGHINIIWQNNPSNDSVISAISEIKNILKVK